MTRSLGTRLVVTATAVLAAFLGLTGLALDRAFRDSAQTAARERLQAQIYMLLGAAEMAASGQVLMPDRLPDPRFSAPGSGLYAQLTEPSGAVAWRSRSLVGTALALRSQPPPGGERFGPEVTAAGAPVLSLALTVVWETRPGSERQFTVQVAEDLGILDGQLQSFRRSLWAWFAGAAVLLLLMQLLFLRWGLAPLRRVAEEVGRVERGEKQRLDGDYPSELQPLTGNLNGLIATAEARLERHRHALADLAHSLKTPLAVLRTTAQGGAGAEEMRAVVVEQVARLSQTVDYQLQRAAAAGRAALASPIAVTPVLERVAASLQKVYAEKRLTFTLESARDAGFPGDEGDLFELLGNLADNACKWARHEVRVSIANDATRPGRASAFLLVVEDDGPGLEPEQFERVLQRGVRADPGTEGHGIGLAVVSELVRTVYGGTLALSRSALGGARFEVRI